MFDARCINLFKSRSREHGGPISFSRAQIHKEVIFRFEAWNPVYDMIDPWREICKKVLKLDFTAHGIMESLSDFGLKGPKDNCMQVNE